MLEQTSCSCPFKLTGRSVLGCLSVSLPGRERLGQQAEYQHCAHNISPEVVLPPPIDDSKSSNISLNVNISGKPTSGRAKRPLVRTTTGFPAGHKTPPDKPLDALWPVQLAGTRRKRRRIYPPEEPAHVEEEQIRREVCKANDCTAEEFDMATSRGAALLQRAPGVPSAAPPTQATTTSSRTPIKIRRQPKRARET